MAIQIGCTGCGKLLSVADEHAGKKARCPACSAILVVPLATGSTQDNSIPSQDGNPWAAPPTTGVYTPPFSNTPVAGQPTVEQFWMRATDGSIYGPTDRDNLNRWFREGRIGAGYQVRRGEDGVWEDATIFRPQAPGAVDILGSAPSVTGSGGMAASSTSNPYAAQYTATGTAAASATPLYKYPKPDRGIIILVMGILSFALCFIFGIVAIVMGRSALSDINAGLANPNDKPLVQIGFWLGVVSLILNFVVFGFAVLMIALSAANQL